MTRFKGAAEGVSHSVKLFWSLSDSFSPFPTISNFSHIPSPHQLPNQAATPPPLPLPPHSPKLEFIVSVVSDPVIMQHSPSFLWLWSFGETPSFPSDQKCTEAQNEQSCAFEQKERQILFCEWKNCLLYIGGEVEVHEGGEGLMVEKKMVERVVFEEKEKKEKVVWFKLWFLYCWREDCRLISSIPRSAAFQTWKRYDWWILNCYTVNFKRINFQTLPSRQFCVFQIHAISLGLQVESSMRLFSFCSNKKVNCLMEGFCASLLCKVRRPFPVSPACSCG